MSFHPYFDFNVPKNITARVGQSAFLNCRVEQLGDKSVSHIELSSSIILFPSVLVVFIAICSARCSKIHKRMANNTDQNREQEHDEENGEVL